MTSGSLHRARGVLAALLVTTVLAGCTGQPDPVVPTAAPEPVLPRPVGMQDPAVIPDEPTVAPGSCDPRASLRPGTLPPPGRMPAGSTMAQIAQRGRLVVGVDQNNYRFGFRDPHSGELTGFDVDLAREIAKAIFGDPDRIQFRAISSGDRIKAIQDGTVDLVVRTMTMTCERWEQVAFSSEYFTAGQRVLVPHDSAARRIGDLRGRKVCAAAGSTSIRNVAAAGAVPVSVVDWTDCLVLLQQHQVAAVSTDDSILAGLAEQDPHTRIVGPKFSDEPYGIAISRSHGDLVRFVNAVLERLRADGTWTRLYNRWLTALGPAPTPPAARYRD
jgi:polar amino acid transport system substrate-binding protein